MAGCGNSAESQSGSETVQENNQNFETDTSRETESASENKEEKVLKFGSFQTTIQPILADELGYFDEQLAPYNIKIEVVKFDTGSEIKEALEAGQITFGSIGAQPAILANNNGTPLQFIGTYKTTEKCNALVARTDAGINDLADLKGKKIGFTAGTTLHNLLLKILDKAGLTEDDVELFPMNASEIKAALETGDIDAGILWEPYITQILKEDNIELVIDGTGLVKEVCGYAVNKEFLEENPEVSAAVLKALDEAWRWSEDNLDEAVSKISESSGSAEDEVRAVFEKSTGDTYITDEKINAIEDTAKYLYSQGLIDTEIKADTIVNTDIQKLAGIEPEQ